MKKKSYSAFQDISDVCEKFKLDYQEVNFIKEKKMELDEYYITRLMRSFNNPGSFSSEFATCERIIFPMIEEASALNNLPAWSQMPLNVDKDLNLWGSPDYILAPPVRASRRFKLPVVCLGEAKKNDFEKGWGQVGAEMYAAQLANLKKIEEERIENGLVFDNKISKQIKNIPIYGLVTDGNVWEFGKLDNKLFTINKEPFKTPSELNKTFDTLNWMFCEARKNADQLLMLNS